MCCSLVAAFLIAAAFLSSDALSSITFHLVLSTALATVVLPHMVAQLANARFLGIPLSNHLTIL